MGRKVAVTIATAGTVVNYPLSFEASEAQNLVIQEVIAGNRWDVDITQGSKEYTARYEAELVSGLPFYLVLGSVTPGIVDYPRTIYPHASLPLSTICASSDADTIHVDGCKCDRLRLNWGAGEFITYEAEFVGTGTLAQAAVAGTTDWSVDGITCASLRVVLDGSTLDEVQSGYLEVNNNLVSRYACGKGKDPQYIRVQRLEVTGGITVGKADINQFSTGGQSLDIEIYKLGYGTLKIMCGSVWFDELPDEFTGHDVYEVEFTWTGQPISGGNMMVVTDSTSINFW